MASPDNPTYRDRVRPDSQEREKIWDELLFLKADRVIFSGRPDDIRAVAAAFATKGGR
jgi:hypothetical protein